MPTLPAKNEAAPSDIDAAALMPLIHRQGIAAERASLDSRMERHPNSCDHIARHCQPPQRGAKAVSCGWAEHRTHEFLYRAANFLTPIIVEAIDV